MSAGVCPMTSMGVNISLVNPIATLAASCPPLLAGPLGSAEAWIARGGFGSDSVIEASAGLVIVWLFSNGRGASPAAERQAQRLIAALVIGAVAVREGTKGWRGEARCDRC